MAVYRYTMHGLFVQHFSKEDEDDVDSEDAGMEWNLAGSEMAQSMRIIWNLSFICR